jgi:hypothetical protein
MRQEPSPLPPLRRSVPELFGWAVLAAVVVAMVLRLPVGLDLSDEAYYAAFIDDWLKGAIGTSTLSTLHQTSALVVYPAAWLYAWATGGTDGLYLFLRALFLLGALASSAAWLIFMRRLGEATLAPYAAAIVLAFTPFSLPAPSYNTLGQQGIVIALAAYGCAFLSTSRPAQSAWGAVAAIAGAVTTLAYPSLVVAFATLGLLTLIYHPRRWLHLAMMAAAAAIIGGLAIAILTPQRLWESVVYLNAVNDAGGLARKVDFSLGLLRSYPVFAGLAVAAAIVGLARHRIPNWATALAIGLIALATLSYPPALFSKSHEVVTLAALCGLGLLAGLRPGAEPGARLFAILYATSLAASFAITISATNAIYNSCIGLVPAAALALLPAKPDRRNFALSSQVLAALACLVAILTTTLGDHYGELPGPDREPIATGFYAGIAARPSDHALLELVRMRVTPLLAADPTIAVIGRSPGIILDTPARPLMLTVFPLQPNVPQAGLEATARFYADPARRPAVVLIYKDPYFEPLNPIGPEFERWYRPVERVPTPLGTLSIFARR